MSIAAPLVRRDMANQASSSLCSTPAIKLAPAHSTMLAASAAPSLAVEPGFEKTVISSRAPSPAPLPTTPLPLPSPSTVVASFVSPFGTLTNGLESGNGEVCDETESSSYDSEDESDPLEDPDEQVCMRGWQKERCDLAWRWSWLQLQVAELQHQVNICDDLYQKLRRDKEKVVPLSTEEEDDSALRISGVSRLSKNRKLCRKAPFMLSARSSISEGVDNHPLFSLKEKRRSIKFGKTKKSPPLPKPVPVAPVRAIPKRDRKRRASYFSEDDEFLEELMEGGDDESDEDDEDDLFSVDGEEEDEEGDADEDDSDEFTIGKRIAANKRKPLTVSIPKRPKQEVVPIKRDPTPPTSAPSTPQQPLTPQPPSTPQQPHTPQPPATPQPQTPATPATEKKKKALRTRDFDIDNVVIPFSVNSNFQIPVIQYKEIHTPQWRVVEDRPAPFESTPPISTPPMPTTPSTPPVVSPSAPTLAPSTQTPSPSAIEKAKREAPIAVFHQIDEEQDAKDALEQSDGESTEEDTSDEVFTLRHTPHEEEERRKYEMPLVQKKKTTSQLSSSTSSLPSQLSTSPTLSTVPLAASTSSLPIVASPTPRKQAATQRPQRRGRLSKKDQQPTEFFVTSHEVLNTSSEALNLPPLPTRVTRSQSKFDREYTKLVNRANKLLRRSRRKSALDYDQYAWEIVHKQGTGDHVFYIRKVNSNSDNSNIDSSTNNTATLNTINTFSNLLTSNIVNTIAPPVTMDSQSELAPETPSSELTPSQPPPTPSQPIIPPSEHPLEPFPTAMDVVALEAAPLLSVHMDLGTEPSLVVLQPSPKAIHDIPFDVQLSSDLPPGSLHKKQMDSPPDTTQDSKTQTIHTLFFACEDANPPSDPGRLDLNDDDVILFDAQAS